MPPRPALASLAGGYRRIPVLQLGADVFCDSNLILRVLDTVQPTPPLHGDDDALSGAVSQWLEPRTFAVFSPLAFRTPQDAGGAFGSDEVRRAFARDRAGFMAPMLDVRKNRENVATCAAHARILAAWVDARLVDGRPFLTGAAPTHADFSAFHPFFWLRDKSARADFLAEFERLWRWVERIDALGEGARTPIDTDEALRVARESEPRFSLSERGGPGDPEPGTMVRVAPTDYGVDPVEGELASIGLSHVSLYRTTEETGRVAVHFPRWGYRIDAV